MADKDILETINAMIKDHVTEKKLVKQKSVFIHAGKFTYAELRQRSFNAPALFLTCLGWKEAREEDQAALSGSELIIESRLAIGIVTSHAKGIEARNAQAQALAQSLSLLLNKNDWGLDNALTTKGLRAEGLFVPAAEEDNHTMWLVSWHQVFGISEESAEQMIHDWLRYVATHMDANDDEHIMAIDNVEISEETNQ